MNILFYYNYIIIIFVIIIIMITYVPWSLESDPAFLINQNDNYEYKNQWNKYNHE